MSHISCLLKNVDGVSGIKVAPSAPEVNHLLFTELAKSDGGI